MSLLLTASKELFVSPEPFALESGEVLSGLEIVYEIHGPEAAPLVAVLGGISAGANPATHPDDPRSGWWKELVGPGLALDSRRFRILGLEFFGGPSCPLRKAGGWQPERITPRDQARILARLLRGIEIGPLDAFVGASYGGMVGLAFAEEEAGLVSRLCVIAAAHRPDAWAQGLRSQQRRILRLGRESGGKGTALARECLAIARALALLSYRGRDEFEERFATRAKAFQPTPKFECETYLEARGKQFAETFDARAYMTLSQAIDLQDVDPASVSVPTFLISFDSDLIVPVSLMSELHHQLARPMGHRCLISRYGHDAFLKETEQLAPLIRTFLEGGEE